MGRSANILLLIGCLGAPLSALASEWAKDANTGCLIWHGDPTPPDGLSISWSGRCEDGRASGTGTWEVKAKGRFLARFTGTLTNGKAEGFGTFQDAEGQSYEGEFRNGKMNGWGKMKAGAGMIYEGEFKDGTMHGEATLTQPDGTRLKGRFERGMPVGRLVSDPNN